MHKAHACVMKIKFILKFNEQNICLLKITGYTKGIQYQFCSISHSQICSKWINSCNENRHVCIRAAYADLTYFQPTLCSDQWNVL